MSDHTSRLTVNEDVHRLSVPANRLLLHLLRDDLGLTGTREGCSVGVCGARSVLVNGILTPQDALEPEAPILHPESDQYAYFGRALALRSQTGMVDEGGGAHTVIRRARRPRWAPTRSTMPSARAYSTCRLRPSVCFQPLTMRAQGSVGASPSLADTRDPRAAPAIRARVARPAELRSAIRQRRSRTEPTAPGNRQY